MSAVEPEGLFFLDTNILVYSFDFAHSEKRQTARRLLSTAMTTQRGAISSQVVQEFLNISLRGFARPIIITDLREYLDTVLAPLCLHFPSVNFYAQALVIQIETGYSWYDALIVSAALELGCSTLFSEDLQHGRVIRGMAIRNPFHAS
jgi:predicted nucleic acid-binding protein